MQTHYKCNVLANIAKKMANTKQEQKIILPKGVAKRLRDEFEVSYLTVRYALSYRWNSVQSRMIRQRALQQGGKLVKIETTEI